MAKDKIVRQQNAEANKAAEAKMQAEALKKLQQKQAEENPIAFAVPVIDALTGIPTGQYDVTYNDRRDFEADRDYKYLVKLAGWGFEVQVAAVDAHVIPRVVEEDEEETAEETESPETESK